METNKLRYFHAVATTGSVHGAAASLSITPGAVSKAVQTLARETRLQLTVADGRGIRLTAAGRRLAELAAPLLASADTLTAQLPGLRAVGRGAAPLRIATYELFSTHLLDLAPAGSIDQALQLVERAPRDVEAAVRSGHADLGLTMIPVHAPDLRHTQLGMLRSSIWGAPRFASVNIDELPFVVPVHDLAGAPTVARQIDGWNDALPPRHEVAEVGLLASALAMCRAGSVVAYLPDAVARGHNSVTIPEAQLVRASASNALPDSATRQTAWLVQPLDEAVDLPRWLRATLEVATLECAQLAAVPRGTSPRPT